MSEAIIVALITGGLALIGVWYTNRSTTAKVLARLEQQSVVSDQKLETEIRVVKTELENMTREVRAHNEFARRMPAVEEQIKAANQRIDNIEHRIA